MPEGWAVKVVDKKENPRAARRGEICRRDRDRWHPTPAMRSTQALECYLQREVAAPDSQAAVQSGQPARSDAAQLLPPADSYAALEAYRALLNECSDLLRADALQEVLAPPGDAQAVVPRGSRECQQEAPPSVTARPPSDCGEHASCPEHAQRDRLAPDATTLAKVARMRERLKPASRRVSLNAQP